MSCETKVAATCSICVESTYKHLEITCNYCQEKACRKCTQRYLLEAANNHCMFCRKQWNREFLHSQPFTKAFLNGELKHHREDVLLDYHKSLLPETQLELEKELIYKNLKTKIARESAKHNQLNASVLDDIEKKIQAERTRLYNYYKAIIKSSEDNLKQLKTELRQLQEGENKNQKREFIRNCVNPDCKGFLSTRWVCGLCETKVCPKCHEKIGENMNSHTCDSKIVESVKEMEKNTKACPKCAALIYRVEGCDQMWCTVCKTPWSWKTGRVIVSGPIHNPHFYEWQRKQKKEDKQIIIPRQLGDMQCGGIPSLRELTSVLNLSVNTCTIEYDEYRKMQRIYDEVHRGITHNRETVQASLRQRDTDQDAAFIFVRKNYLLNEISSEIMKQKLQQIEKRREKVRGIAQIVEMFCVAAIDILQKMIYPVTVYKTNVNGYTKTEFDGFLNELATLKNYTVDQFDKFRKCYNDCVVPKFTGWMLHYS